MTTALALWRPAGGSADSVSTSHRPKGINWPHCLLKIALIFMLVGTLFSLAAHAQNLGTSPQFGQAVQGQQATTVEGTVLNIVNWGAIETREQESYIYRIEREALAAQ